MNLSQALDMSIAKLRTRLVQQHIDTTGLALEDWQRQCDEKNGSRKSELLYSSPWDVYEWMMAHHIDALLRDVLATRRDAKYFGHLCYYVPDDVAVRRRKAAEKYADGALATFKDKMERKLLALGSVNRVAFSGYGPEDNILTLTYASASMEIHNDVILKRSIYGKLFNQYPTTFRNVVINGKPVEKPSEAKVKRLMTTHPATHAA